MSESQSRYSIISRLTNQKLSIMDKKIELEDEIENKKISLEIQIEEIDSWEAERLAEISQEKKLKQQRIETTKKQLNHLEKIKKEKIDSYDQKIAEVDKALVTLTNISNSAAKEAAS